ncbi:hypothetical protein L7F22_001687 [Adiantum nelumboides]|nr:hypothetical protein [Adiantum nelumboides]
MADPVEIILEFLQRNQFAMAEAAFKAELLSRSKGENPVLLSENVTDWDLQLRSSAPNSLDAVTQDLDRLDTSSNKQIAMLGRVPVMDRNFVHASDSKKEELRQGSMTERLKFPPEKQLYIEYESGGQSKSQEPLYSVAQDFAFVNRQESMTVGSTTGHATSAMHEFESTMQGSTQKTICKDVDRPSSGSSAIPSKPLHADWQLQPEERKLSGPASFSGNLEPIWQKQPSTVSTSASQGPDQLSCKTEARRKELVSNEPRMACSTLKVDMIQRSSRGAEKKEYHSCPAELEVPSSNSFAVKATLDSERPNFQELGDATLQLQNGFLPSSTREGPFKEPALKTPLPLSFMMPLHREDDQRNTIEFAVLDDERGAGGYGWNGNELQKFEVGGPFTGCGVADSTPFPSSQELTANGLSVPETLPRLPPVRIHSVDKNMDTLKEGGTTAENENSTRSFDSAAFKSMASTPEGPLGWEVLADGLMGQDMSALGLKRPVSRPSVSQGIVEDLSEQLSGFATAVDGQSERWYPDDYCDSDTWEDDDDPGYHRQPIEDEEWFLAHEIDYPSDDERGRQHTDKSHLADVKQPNKLDEDDRSFVEEESYFSGEEYYRQEAAKKEAQRLQMSESKEQMDRSKATYSTIYLTNIDDNVLNLSRGNNDGNDYDGQLYDSEEISLMASQPVWKGFMYQADQLEQVDTMSSGYQPEDRRGDGIDDDNHGSVRSGLLVSSDAADVGSEMRESLLGGSSEGDVESLKYQELAAYGPAHGPFKPHDFSSTKEGRHVEVKNAPVRHLDEDEDERDVILQYYSEEWGHSKESGQREAPGRSNLSAGLQIKEQSKGRQSSSRNNKAGQDNGSFVFEGFSFPSPSSTCDVAGSRAGSGKSLWSNKESAVRGEDTEGYGSGLVGPDDTLAAWKRKSNNSSPGIGSSEDNLPNVILSNHSCGSLHSTDEYVSLEAREDSGGGGRNLGGSFPKASEALVQEDDEAAIAQEDLRTLAADEDQYEVFDLRIVHRKNRTGFEEDKEFPVMINSVIAGRYHVTEYLGSAAFSKALQAHDLHTGMDVCLKIIKNNKDFFDQSLDEIKLLKFVNKHDPADKYHLLRLYDYFYHREHLFIVCELLRANLYEFHKFNRESGGEVYFTMPRLQSITLQCLEALEYLHRLGIIHCDLKPENILVKSYSRCEIKIIDLGSSCFQTDHLCSYVQSRSYRAPEVILGRPYDQKIDIWSLGCILAELCTGNVLFQNDSLATLLARVVGILGPLDLEVLAKGRDTHKYFTKNHMLYERNQNKEIPQGAPDLGANLVSPCIQVHSSTCIPFALLCLLKYRMDGYKEEGSFSQDRQSIPIVREVGEGSSQAEEGFPHAAFSNTGTASPGTLFGGMQSMVPNPMYANIGLHPGFQGTQGQFGVSQGNLGIAGFSIPPVNMTPRHQHVTGQGVQMAPTGTFFDDMIVFSKSEAEHIEHVRAVFEMLRKERLVVKGKKSEFFMEEIHFLGHIVSKDGIKIDLAKIKAIQD